MLAHDYNFSMLFSDTLRDGSVYFAYWTSIWQLNVQVKYDNFGVVSWSTNTQVPSEFKDVLDNTVVAALSHPSPLVSIYLSCWHWYMH